MNLFTVASPPSDREDGKEEGEEAEGTVTVREWFKVIKVEVWTKV